MSRHRTSKNVKGEKTTAREGRFSYDGLDRVLHEKARLGILGSLASNAGGLRIIAVTALKGGVGYRER